MNSSKRLDEDCNASYLTLKQLEAIESASKKHDGVPHGIVSQLLDHIRLQERRPMIRIEISEAEYSSVANVIRAQLKALMTKIPFIGSSGARVLVVSHDLVPHLKVLEQKSIRDLRFGFIFGMPICVDYLSKGEVRVVIKQDRLTL
jgi:hypothetical protein